MIALATVELLRHLYSRPGHDEVKADFRQLLVAEFGAEPRLRPRWRNGPAARHTVRRSGKARS